MGFRFFRRVSVAPGVRINFSKSGASLSFGGTGAWLTVGRRGARATAGIPGTGLYYTEQLGRKRKRTGKSRARGQRADAAVPDESELVVQTLEMGLLKRLVTPAGEKAFVDACKAFIRKDYGQAARRGAEGLDCADSLFIAGLANLKLQNYEKAAELLRLAAASKSIGSTFRKYGVAFSVEVAIAPEIMTLISADRKGALLCLAEACQSLGRHKEAIEALVRLLKVDPGDLLGRLSLAELLWDVGAEDRNVCRRIVRLLGSVRDESPAHAAAMLYKARALRSLGLLDAAAEVLRAALRRRKGKPADLLKALRYEKALVYEQQGRKALARREFSKLYAEDPDYEDVQERVLSYES